MLRSWVLTLAGGALAALTAGAVASEVGTSFCFGVNCSCGNDDPTAGCANSTGRGGRLIATGSASVAADDIVFEGWYLPPNKVSLLVMSQNARDIPFGDGRMCIGPGMHRLRWHTNTNSGGMVAIDRVIATYAYYGVPIAAGETWHAQLWYRDPVQNFACSSNATVEKTNLTNAYTVTFTP